MLSSCRLMKGFSHVSQGFDCAAPRSSATQVNESVDRSEMSSFQARFGRSGTASLEEHRLPLFRSIQLVSKSLRVAVGDAEM